MLELLGLIGGGLFRLAPLFFEFIKRGQENKQELALLQLNLDLEKQRGVNRENEIREIGAAGEQMAWAQGLVEALKTATPAPIVDQGSWWLNFLNGINVSVRPFLTYWWCIVLHTGNKVLLAYIAIAEKTPLAELSAIIYTDFDRGVVGSIIGFWFVDRALRAHK
jgi:hypothetical protein